jgi:transcriptional regulator with XRE-family HTH domain
METVGERLLRLRVERGLSQDALAECGVSAPYISRIERGQRTASAKALNKLASWLNVSTAELEFGRRDTKKQLEQEVRQLRAENLRLAAQLAELQGEEAA